MNAKASRVAQRKAPMEHGALGAGGGIRTHVHTHASIAKMVGNRSSSRYALQISTFVLVWIWDYGDVFIKEAGQR